MGKESSKQTTQAATETKASMAGRTTHAHGVTHGHHGVSWPIGLLFDPSAEQTWIVLLGSDSPYACEFAGHDY